MKYFAVIVVFAQIAFPQISGQVIRSSSPCGPSAPSLVPNLVAGPFVTAPAPVLAPPCSAPAPIYASPQVYTAPQQTVYAPQPVYTVPSSDVAGSLADTLSLLTVSSLLAEKLPLGYPPVAVSNGCGCGYTQLGGYYL